MILTAHQPVYLPWLGLFHKIALAELFVSFDGVQYLIKDWNNRNRIKTSSGPIWLTVPVLTKGYREKPIRAMEINNSLPWRRKHWQALRLNYAKAPFFNRYAEFWEDVYRREWRMLTELNEHILLGACRQLGLPATLRRASEFTLRGTKSGLVLDMCRTLGADTYVFGALGAEYADTGAFLREGVRPVFQEYRHPVYAQLHGPFVSHLSIVDLLFNCGPESLGILLSGNVTREELLAPGAIQGSGPR